MVLEWNPTLWDRVGGKKGEEKKKGKHLNESIVCKQCNTKSKSTKGQGGKLQQYPTVTDHNMPMKKESILDRRREDSTKRMQHISHQ